MIQRGGFRVQVYPDEIVVDGSVAFVLGRIELIRPDTTVRTVLRYLELVRKEAGGWKAFWGIDRPVQEYEPSA